MGCCSLSDGKSICSANWEGELAAVLPLLPAGLAPIGLFSGGGQASLLSPLEAFAQKLGKGCSLVAGAVDRNAGSVSLYMLEDGSSSFSERQVMRFWLFAYKCSLSLPLLKA